MTMMRTEKLTCPECGHEQGTRVWSTLNVGLDPTLRTRLFEGEINSFVCEQCGFEALLEVPLLYHDPLRGFAVQFHPAQSILDDTLYDLFEPSYPVFIRGLLRDPPPAEPVPWAFMFQPHLVFGLQELVNSVAFFERLLPVALQAQGPE